MTGSGAEKTPGVTGLRTMEKGSQKSCEGEFLGTFVYGPTLTYTKTLAGGSQDE